MARVATLPLLQPMQGYFRLLQPMQVPVHPELAVLAVPVLAAVLYRLVPVPVLQALLQVEVAA